MPTDWSIDAILAFIAANKGWGTLLVGLMAFGESLAFVGVLIPATTVLIAAGALVGAGALPFWEVWAGGAIGASLGDAISYWIGRRLGPGVEQMWPFRSRPHWLAAGERVFARWGWAAVFFGRFIGPLRATVPLAAGIMAMPHWTFQAVNVASAIVWIPVLVAPGAAVSWLVDLGRGGRWWEAAGLGALLLAGLAGLVLFVRRNAPRWLGDGGRARKRGD
ncbi:DedA family protein [Prosthecomicrobium sp. N25]|uniref:DedA family protein n=1 Tax=Prosthecomicrobium sp. N25 TaxID=3129254 RepID=UPI003077273C